MTALPYSTKVSNHPVMKPKNADSASREKERSLRAQRSNPERKKKKELQLMIEMILSSSQQTKLPIRKRSLPRHPKPEHSEGEGSPIG